MGTNGGARISWIESYKKKDLNKWNLERMGRDIIKKFL